MSPRSTTTSRARRLLRSLSLPFGLFALGATPAAGAGTTSCTADADCTALGKICIDGNCKRAGLRNPIDGYDEENHRPKRRDEELFWIGRGTTRPMGIVATPEEAFLLPPVAEDEPLAVAAGRVLGAAYEQAVAVYEEGLGQNRLEVIDLVGMDGEGRVDFGGEAIGSYSFNTGLNSPAVGLAVGDLDLHEEDYPSLEFHDEVVLAYQNPANRRIRLRVLSFEDALAGTDLTYAPSQNDTVLTDITVPAGNASHVSVAVGDFIPEPDGDPPRREIAVVGYDDNAGNLLVQFWQVERQPDGSRNIVPAEAPDGSGLTNLTLSGTGNQPVALLGNDKFDDLSGLNGTFNSHDTLVVATVSSTGQMSVTPYSVHEATLTTTFWTWTAFSDWSETSIAQRTSGEFVTALPDSRVLLSKGNFPRNSTEWGNNQAVLMLDTNYGPVMLIVGFSSEAGAPTTGPLYLDQGQDLIWPPQAELDARSLTTETTPRAWGVGGQFLQYRGERMTPNGNLGRSRIFVSDPDGGTNLSWLYVFSTGLPGGNSGPVLDENGQEIDTAMKFMLAVDMDGDNAVKRFQDASGDLAFTGLGTRYSINNVSTLETALQEPPKHLDYLPAGLNLDYDGILNVSQLEEFAVSFRTTETSEDAFEKETQTDVVSSAASSLTVSGEASYGVEGNSGTVSASMTDKIKETQQDSTGYFTSSTTTVSLSQVDLTERDDILRIEEQPFDTWRFPAMGVYNTDGTDQALPGGEQPENPTFEITFPGAPQSVVGNGRNVDAYQPTHVNGNLFGYPSFDLEALPPGESFQPAELGSFTELLSDDPQDTAPNPLPSGTPLWDTTSYVIGATTTSVTVTYTNSDATSTHTGSSDKFAESQNYEVGAEVEASYGAASGSASVTQEYKFKDKHTVAKAKTSNNTASQSVELSLDVVPILEASLAYRIKPVWFYGTDGGMKVAHAVSTSQGGGGSGTVWNATYSMPDPGLSLPNRFKSVGTDQWELNDSPSRNRMKGLFLRDPDGNDLQSPPSAGEPVHLTARVYNFSPVSAASNVRVLFLAEELVQDVGGFAAIGRRVKIAETVIPCIAAHGDLSSCSEDPIPGAPNNMAEATVVWDTTDFGPSDPLDLRDWRVIVVLDPSDEIDETHEWLDRFDDPLTNSGGTPLDRLEKGQNNEGWLEVSVGADLSSTPGLLLQPDLFVAPGSLVVVEPGAERATSGYARVRKDHRVEVRVDLLSSELDRRNRTLKLIEVDPDGRRRLLSAREVWGLSPTRGKQVGFEWTPRRPGQHTLIATYDEPLRDPKPGNASEAITILVE